jgi:predicted AAA+ superfamily ATPase
MNKLKRYIYLEKLKKLKDKHIIKIITGVRRCGKSTLLAQYYNYLVNDLKIDDRKIIFIKFDDKKNEKLKDSNSLYSFIKKNITNNNSDYYLLLDEIQDVKDFEAVILDLYENGNVDIYLTGSNSYMLSGQIATKFTGRCIQIHVVPFSFKEFVEYKIDILKSDKSNKISLFNEYRKYGGLPITISIEDAEEKIN